ncbi:hypothetical protein B0H19DRAFT_1262151 [Mycena capillaripes]|nr:hypothetical protein B0H19DRAFT_1262151 [Mycena capillaripes]
MSDGTGNGWGGSRVGSGRKKKAVVASSAPTRIQDRGMCLRISTSSASSSVQPNTAQAGRAVNNVACTAGATGFFAPRVSQQPQAVGYPAPPSTVTVQPPSTSAGIVQLNKDLADAALDHSRELIFDESLGDEEGEEDDSVNTEWLKTTLAQIVKDTTGQLKMPRCYKDGHFWVRPIDPVFALNARGGLDTAELDVMKATFAGHFGADPFSKMVRELKVLHHNRLETMYYCAALHFGFRGPNNVPQFSKFEDPLGYAGYAPSRQYFKSMFTACVGKMPFSMQRHVIKSTLLLSFNIFRLAFQVRLPYSRQSLTGSCDGVPPADVFGDKGPCVQLDFCITPSLGL